MIELLGKMRASRAALAHQLDQISARRVLGTELTQKALTSKGFGIAIAAVFAVAVLSLFRQRR